MAEQLEKFPYKKNDGGRWKDYLDGNVWKLSLEETGAKSIESLRSSIHHAAHGSGLGVRTTGMDDDHLVIQSYELPDGH